MSFIEGVTPEEYKSLKSKEAEIIENVKKNFEQSSVQDVKTTIQYQPGRGTVGIFIKKDGELCLNQDNHEERIFVKFLEYELGARLREMRSGHDLGEEWVETI